MTYTLHTSLHGHGIQFKVAYGILAGQLQNKTNVKVKEEDEYSNILIQNGKMSHNSFVMLF
jgi:hypothetical protein